MILSKAVLLGLGNNINDIFILQENCAIYFFKKTITILDISLFWICEILIFEIFYAFKLQTRRAVGSQEEYPEDLAAQRRPYSNLRLT